MIDVMIYESGSGGDFELINGDLATVDGWTNQPYLGMFGGNTEANTIGEEEEGVERFDWWGNVFLLNEPEAQMNSDVERSLQQFEVSSEGIYELEKLVGSDLEFLNDLGEVSIETEIIDNDRIQIIVKIQESDDPGIYKLIWDRTKDTIIQKIIL